MPRKTSSNTGHDTETVSKLSFGLINLRRVLQNIVDPDERARMSPLISICTVSFFTPVFHFYFQALVPLLQTLIIIIIKFLIKVQGPHTHQWASSR